MNWMIEVPVNKHRSIFIKFGSQAEKDFYVKKEYNAVKQIRSKYMGAISVKEAKKWKQAMQDARLRFAKDSGYKPITKGSKYWIFKSKDKEIA